VNPAGHYENFPVASVLVPKSIRADVIHLYRFARGADDIADEGDASPTQRAHTLERWAAAVQGVARGEPSDIGPVSALAPLLRSGAITPDHLHALLSAFTQDTHTRRYPTYEAVLDYCARSANPVGRLMLQLMAVHDPAAQSASDAICTALQLTNFWQDVAVDWRKDRVYIPTEDLHRFAVSERDIQAGLATAQWHALMAFEVNRTRELMLQGRAILPYVYGRMKWEIAFTMAGGLTILDAIEHVNYDVFSQRPTLSWLRSPRLLTHTLRLLFSSSSP
jgi:squalene synthase HpnC